MEDYLGLSGHTYTVGDAISDEAIGAEGSICEIINNTTLVAKIYHDGMTESESTELEKKLKLMINKEIVEAQGVFSIAWPRDLLYKNTNGRKIFVGYVMRKVSASYNLSDLTHHNPDDPDPDPNGIDGYITWKELIQAAYNLARLVEYLHKNGIEIGDFNERNFLFDETTGGFDLIDCGTYGIFDTKTLKTIYPSRYSMPKYSAPEKLLGLDISNPKSTDCFYLAIHIFHLLMQNSEPFGYKENSDGNPISKLHEHIANGDCLYVRSISGKVLRKHSIKPGVLPDDILEAFNRTFNYTRENIVSKIRNRTTASEWCEVLEPYLTDDSRIIKCATKKEHVYSSHLAECPWCNPISVPDIPFEQRQTVRHSENDIKKTRPNDPCPCGSGKKYKYCHGSEKLEGTALKHYQNNVENENLAKAEAVSALIGRIGIGGVHYSDEYKKKIYDARNAYNKLTPTQKTLVNRYSWLIRAENEYKNLEKEALAKERRKKKRNRLLTVIGSIIAASVVCIAIFSTNLVGIDHASELSDAFIATAKQGDEFVFGKYEQDNNIENGTEDIEWVVLGNENGAITAMSKYCIEDMPFNDGNIDTPTNWSESTIREWLNTDFYDSAFSDEEKSKIMLSHHPNPGNKTFDVDGCEDTDDYVFLMGEDTIESFYDDYKFGAVKVSNKDNGVTMTVGMSEKTEYEPFKAQYTEYAKHKYIESEELANYDALEKKYGKNSCFWWTRVTGDENYSMFQIINSGAAASTPAKANCGIRPLIVIMEKSEERSNSMHYYHMDIKQNNDGPYNNDFGPNFWIEASSMNSENQLYEVKDEFLKRLTRDPVMATACFAYVDKEMGTQYTGEFYSSISNKWYNSNKWISELNRIAEEFINNKKLWSDNAQALIALLNDTAISIDEVQGGNIKTLWMDKGDEHPVLQSGSCKWQEDTTFHYLTFTVKIKDEEKKLSFLIETGFTPVLEDNE